MSFLSKVKNKILGIDAFYEEVCSEQIARYQYYFSKIIYLIDIDTQTKWSMGKEYDRAQMQIDEEIMERIATVEAAGEGLSPAILQVMINQYFFADVHQREMDKENWVNRVIHRKDTDYFPSGWQVRILLDNVS